MPSSRVRLIIGALDGTASMGASEDHTLPPEDRLLSAVPVQRTLEEIYRTRAPRLLRYFSRRAGSSDAEDLVQESFARLARMESSGASEVACPDAYLTRIASNLVQDRAKSAFQRALARQVPADDVPLPGFDPLEALEARDVLNRLNAAILRLSPTTREVFMAHRLDGFSHAEIAERTGLSMASVARRMSKAIDQVRRVMRSR